MHAWECRAKYHAEAQLYTEEHGRLNGDLSITRNLRASESRPVASQRKRYYFISLIFYMFARSL